MILSRKVKKRTFDDGSKQTPPAASRLAGSPMTPEDRDALRELDSRIAAMERRLRNAKTSRRTDSTLINRLLTSEYHWDEERDQRARPQLPQRAIQLYNDIPSGTKLLDSDVARVRRRLTEIAQQLGTIRETRLNLSSGGHRQQYTTGHTDPVEWHKPQALRTSGHTHV
ncbi:unnamed protein product [Nippostrongylus brasiliensis]|uniref:Uncharacterized protein n=1 Tax=Nippostrongylus brasiliensis TaxID=27835 RepID=A0A0N4YBZ0_NIPBR|nr:unnamed protein product [Nippostrongylus brasiliensis]